MNNKEYLDLQDLIDKANDLRLQIDKESKELFELKEEIKLRMQKAGIRKIEGVTGKANFFNQMRTLLNVPKFRKRCPKIFERYSYSSWSDTLRLSSVKEA